MIKINDEEAEAILKVWKAIYGSYIEGIKAKGADDLKYIESQRAPHIKDVINSDK